MLSEREIKKLGREKLQQIVDTCKSIGERSLDPFLVDIKENLDTVKKYFPEWNIPDDLCLDSETIHQLASVIKLQSEWVKHRSTTLYADPFLLDEKLRSIDKIELLSIFIKTWHPTVELEQISIQSLAEALRYWESLAPMNERWNEMVPTEIGSSTTTREELVNQRILRDKAFSEELNNFWQELKRQVAEKGENGKMLYESFVYSETYSDTVNRAFLTSFLVTYGYATLEIHPLEEEIFIIPYEKPLTKTAQKQLVSIPIALTAENWSKWKSGNEE
jgi:hypothetical protein